MLPLVWKLLAEINLFAGQDNGRWKCVIVGSERGEGEDERAILDS